MSTLANVAAKSRAKVRRISRLDDVMATIPKEDAELLRSWLNDPHGWTPYHIEKAMGSYAKETGRDVAINHSTVERWRQANGIPDPT